ncbi:MAG: PQQ-dependent sugar dehydrogenase [Steroidobacteraceae bacterium]|jgi:glucose/arabinose dehydrogenase
MRSSLAALALAAASALCATAMAAAPDLSLLKLPSGFRIEVWADGVDNARSMVRSDSGTVFVGTRTAGKVYAIREREGRREVRVIAQGLNVPNGVALQGGALYVAENDKISRYDDIESKLDAPSAPALVTKLTADRWHGWRYIAFGPDRKLYVTLGAPCNVCDKDAEGYSQIVRMNADGSGREVVAHGVRNSVGLTWHPQTRELWFTDNGRDMLGDDLPPCEINRVKKIGAHYGFPFCHAGDVVDPEFGKLGRCEDTVAPVQRLGAHVAPLGLQFYSGAQFPRAWRGRLLFAEHGSWNRSSKVGYRLAQLKFDGARVVGYEDFVTGWLRPDGKVVGRPVDVLQWPDGSILVSDDLSGVIYRISYDGGR